MDRDEAMRLLEGGHDGVQEWNQRRTDGEEIPSLEGADCPLLLVNANFSGTNLRGARLGHVDLRAADLTSADLSHADLRVASLNHAKLKHANLDHANPARNWSAPARLGMDSTNLDVHDKEQVIGHQTASGPYPRR